MMNISVRSVHFRADEKLLSYVNEKLSRLNRYFDRTVEAEVHLKLQDNGGPVHEKIAEVKIHVPGGWLMDKRSGRTFEAAINASSEALKRQLTRHKERVHQRGPGIKGLDITAQEDLE